MSLDALIYIAVAMMGIAAALVGTFAHYRGRTLLADACAHATLPGVGIGFLVALTLGVNGGRSLPTMMIGAGVAATIAAWCVRAIETRTPLGRDVAIAAILSVFYGLGIVLLSYIQRLENAAQAGLEGFLLGQITGLSVVDTYFIICCAAGLGLITTLLGRRFTHLCFDETHMRSSALTKHTRLYDTILTALIIAVLCVGIRMMGVILILALLIIPPITARIWSANMTHLLTIAASVGGASCFIGAALSTHIDDLPTGATIVLCAAAAFIVSIILRTTIDDQAQKRGSA